MATFVISVKQTQLLENDIVASSVINTIYVKNATKWNVLNTVKFSNNIKKIKIGRRMSKIQQ
jgi:hypothetical protein